MTSQGWTPGQFLGASDAAHAEHYTAANASHIRVILKDDNLGLGAKRGRVEGVDGDSTGLDVFQNLLGRLNAKDDDELAAIEKEQKSREDLKRAIYTEQKWGSIRFVKGGLLVGDRIEKLIEDEAERVKGLKASEKEVDSSESETSSEEEVVVKEKAKKSKKEKKSKKQVEEAVTEDSTSSARKAKSKRKRKAEDDSIDSSNSTEKSKKRRKSEKIETSSSIDQEAQKALDKAARKAARKEERRREKKDKKREEQGVTSIEVASPALSTPASSTPNSRPGTPNSMMGGRHAVRSRNIMQKRMASMDPTALAQIFMIKS